jgi:hypothetical protein
MGATEDAAMRRFRGRSATSVATDKRALRVQAREEFPVNHLGSTA